MQHLRANTIKWKSLKYLKIDLKINLNIVWQYSTAGHTEDMKKVSYDKFLNTDPA
jgi:hypothetical protein